MQPSVFLVVALLIWFLPLRIFRAKNAKLGSFDQRAWPRGRNLVLGLFDLARAWVGGDLLVRSAGVFPAFGLDPSWGGGIFIAAVFAVALAIQSFAWRTEDYLFAPVGFVLGCVGALIEPLVLIIALPLGVGMALAIRAWSAGFIGAALGLAGVGLAVAQDWRLALLLGVALLTPVLLSVMAGRHLGSARK